MFEIPYQKFLKNERNANRNYWVQFLSSSSAGEGPIKSRILRKKIEIPKRFGIFDDSRVELSWARQNNFRKILAAGSKFTKKSQVWMFTKSRRSIFGLNEIEYCLPNLGDRFLNVSLQTFLLVRSLQDFFRITENFIQESDWRIQPRKFKSFSDLRALQKKIDLSNYFTL